MFAKLDAAYPNPEDPSEEYCFEELRAKHRGWLDCQWSKEGTRTTDNEPETGSQHLLDPEAIPLSDETALRKPVETLERKFQKTLALNDVDENGMPLDQAQDLERRLRKEEKANRTRKIKVMEVKAETQTGKCRCRSWKLRFANIQQCKQISHHPRVQS